MDLTTTPLIEKHRALGAKLAPFGGWLMPIQYAGILAEHQWTRSSASIFDICHMGEFLIRGNADASGFNKIVTFDLNALATGSCRYGFMLNGSGGIIDDLIVYRLGPEEWMVVVNAATTPNDAAHFRAHLSPASHFTDVSASLAKLDLQGPLSLACMQKLIGPRVAELRYYTFGRYDLLGETVTVSRTGYTGELGYEIYISNGRVEDLWDRILADDRVRPAGLGARDTLRLEMAYPLYGQDLTEETTPIEGDKEPFIDLRKDFLGKAGMLAAGRPYRRLIYFTAASRRAPRHNYRIVAGGKDVGVVTSGSFSPSLSCGIGMGYVTVPCPAGTAIVLKDQGIEIAATVTEKPFYKHGTARRPERVRS